MANSTSAPWLLKLFFRLTVGLTTVLFLVVMLAPWLSHGATPRDTWSLVLAAFARDAVVRRTTLGAGVGLLVTAFVFFRPPQSRSSTPPSPPGRIAGA